MDTGSGTNDVNEMVNGAVRGAGDYQGNDRVEITHLLLIISTLLKVIL